MNEEKKEYLSLYMLQEAKLRRLDEMKNKNPGRREEYNSEIAGAYALRTEIEAKIEAVDGGILSELLYLKYVCGKTMLEISYILNYSLRHIERLHLKALNRFKM